jgi:hypothetical protein
MDGDLFDSKALQTRLLGGLNLDFVGCAMQVSYCSLQKLGGITTKTTGTIV